MKNNKGFIALFFVTIISFLAVFFVMTNAPRSWIHAQGADEIRSSVQARFQAISCINVIRQRIFIEQNLATVEIDGDEYLGSFYIKDGYCEVERVYQQSGRIFIQTSATKNGIKITLETEFENLDSDEGLEAASILER